MTVFVILVSLLIIGLVLFSGILLYNRLTRLRNSVKASWYQVDVELQRRCDLIPNLVTTVKGAAAFESTVLENVVAARTSALAAKPLPPNARQAPEQEVTAALGTLLALAEANPVLRAAVNFQDLQEELGNTEDRIAASRSFYNQNVEEYNGLRLTFPTNILAQTFKFPAEPYFEVSSLSIRHLKETQFTSQETEPDGGIR